MIKKKGKLCVCIDFRNLKNATLNDILVDSTIGNTILVFMDGYLRYNQIFIAKDDISKTAFRCPGLLRTYKWVMMPFDQKNTKATY